MVFHRFSSCSVVMSQDYWCQGGLLNSANRVPMNDLGVIGQYSEMLHKDLQSQIIAQLSKQNILQKRISSSEFVRTLIRLNKV